MNCLLKFSAINQYFIGNHNLLERGENAFYSNHVVRVNFDPKLMMIRAKVNASMKARVYDVEIYLSDDFTVQKANCKCPRGIEICHHIAAAMFASRYEVSKTDLPCSWVPTPSVDNTKSWKELYGLKSFKRLTERDLSEREIEEFATNIRNELCCGFAWILKDEPVNNGNVEIAVDVNAFLLSSEYENAPNPAEWLQQQLEVNEDQIKLIANATVEQHSNIDWFNVRRFRVTASNFGALIGSIQRNRYPPSLFNRLLGQRSLDGIKSVQWGKTHEVDGIKEIERYLGVKVVKTGVWLCKSGMLGASPDGFIDDSVVEVKCRYKSKDSSLSKDLSNDSSYIIWFNTASNVWIVNENHHYFHQIQGQIHLTNAKGCYLVVWTPIETAVVYIEKNSSWAKWIKEMEKFYIEKFIPFLKQNC